MLVLRRKAGEAIVLNGTITIHVLAVEGERVKLGINAPPEVVIVRSELLEGGGTSGPGSSMPGAPIPPREQRPYTYRDPNGHRPHPEPEEDNPSGETPGPGRTPNGSMYGGPARYASRRRMYDNQPAPSSALPNPNPRYR